MSSAWKPRGSLGALQAKPRSVEKMRNNHQNLGVRESCDAVSLTVLKTPGTITVPRHYVGPVLSCFIANLNTSHN